MKTKLFTPYTVILLFVLLFTSCSKEKPPELKVSDTELSFTTYPDKKPFVISNNGEEELSWQISGKPDWVELSKSSGKITTNDDTVMISVDIDQAVGTYSGKINISSNGGNKDITITLEIGIWQERIPMPTKRCATGAVVIDGKIYVIGGLKTEDIALSNLEVYDPLTNVWIEKTPMPTARGDCGCAVVGGKIYMIGGVNPDVVATVEVYDPATDRWTTKKPLPAARGHVTACAVGTKIYVIGGSEQSEDLDLWSGLNKVEEYDTETDSWKTKENMPSSRWGLSSCLINGKIYTIGGNQYPNQPGTVNTVEVYDPAQDTWTSKQSMPTARYSLSCSLVNGKIYAIGGWLGSSGGPLYSQVEEYDPVTNTWKSKSRFPDEIALLSTCTVNGKIYAIGGTITDHPFTRTNNVYVYDPATDL
jgi:N-acetylneuraminic acid mutarotase